MNRQQLFDNFFRLVNGKGRALSSDGRGCLYFPPNDDPRTVHPGCAIGCQPGFREQFGGFNFDGEGSGIKGIVQKNADVASFFQVENASDIDFLGRLQEFHDNNDNWAEDGLHLGDWEVRNFCRNEGLISPFENS